MPCAAVEDPETDVFGAAAPAQAAEIASALFDRKHASQHARTRVVADARELLVGGVALRRLESGDDLGQVRAERNLRLALCQGSRQHVIGNRSREQLLRFGEPETVTRHRTAVVLVEL